jgi:hypothetical protein
LSRGRATLTLIQARFKGFRRGIDVDASWRNIWRNLAQYAN